MATATTYAAGLAAGFAAAWRSCVENKQHEEDEDENLLLPTTKAPAPPAALCTSPPPPPPPPSPLLALLEQVPDLFTEEVLARLTPTDRALLGRASRACRAVVVESTALKAQQEAAAATLAVEKAAAEAAAALREPLGEAGFISSSSFAGAKLGYTYKTGDEGLGYYVDTQGAANLRSSLHLALARARRPLPRSLPFWASNFVASFELSVWAVANGCGWMQMARAVGAKQAAEAATEAAAAAQAAAESAAAKAAAAEKAAAAAAAAELSACVESAFLVFNDMDVNAAGLYAEDVAAVLSDRFHGDMVCQAIQVLIQDGHVYALCLDYAPVLGLLYRS